MSDRGNMARDTFQNRYWINSRGELVHSNIIKRELFLAKVEGLKFGRDLSRWEDIIPTADRYQHAAFSDLL